ncbi:MAG: bifunctional DNA-binding transcriptional regulator/O6-methylguanine-DNA methyltransferase Ada [Candidatus Eremiobacteraeota bacterium]|nr:bifunctional DNA-binding transcriptional regulator/O6-methylguanine-DNA methyltransferase Ada [Candidatus Eremiobacteraeota bacterium]MBV9409303.1 bifunctional DNA-binding transcriptional regulator/O6-methylguanine-DNA methyltransferase Ada [Candidatus Eremiobacteraeota bacterium]
MEQIDDTRWETVLARGRDDDFVFGVKTTSIYCRSGCPSRTPARRNVFAFPNPAAAEAAGFRPCKRCAPDDVAPDADRVRLIERACALLDAEDAPSLAGVASEVGLSRFHFQRLFRKVVGVTPGEYVRARRDERFRTGLAGGASVTTALHDAGYGSSSRPYANGTLGMTPTRYREGGRDERMTYAIAPCSLGRVLVATTERGVCAIDLGDDEEELGAALARQFPNAERVRDDAGLRETVDAAVALVDDPSRPFTLPLDVRGTAFQRRVWSALRAMKPGEHTTYAALAVAVGSPGAAQAVGSACAANKLAVAIPCHRVVREDGGLAGYRWGIERKRELLAQEASA